MKEDDCLAPVQFAHHRLERRVAGIFSLIARHHAHAIGLERVLAVFDLAEAAIDVRQRNGGEHAEAAGMIRHEARAVVVAFPREFRAASLSPNQTLGSLVETMEVATPLLSISSMALLGVHNSIGRWFVFLAAMAAINPGAEKW